MVQHIPQETTVGQLLNKLMMSFRSMGLIPPSEVPVHPNKDRSSNADAPPKDEESKPQNKAPAEDKELAADAAKGDGEKPETEGKAATGAAAGLTISFPEGLMEQALGLYRINPSTFDERSSASREGRPGSPLREKERERKETGDDLLSRIPFSSTVRDLLDSYGHDGVSFGFLVGHSLSLCCCI